MRCHIFQVVNSTCEAFLTSVGSIFLLFSSWSRKFYKQNNQRRLKKMCWEVWVHRFLDVVAIHPQMWTSRQSITRLTERQNHSHLQQIWINDESNKHVLLDWEQQWVPWENPELIVPELVYWCDSTTGLSWIATFPMHKIYIALTHMNPCTSCRNNL